MLERKDIAVFRSFDILSSLVKFEQNLQNFLTKIKF